MRRLLLGCVLLLVLCPGQSAAEEPSELDRAKASFKAGAAAYAAGDYLASIQALDAAYSLTPLPAIAFSLAQAERRQYFVDHERAHLGRAIALFRLYVDALPGGARRADALDALSQLEPLAGTLGREGPQQPEAEASDRHTRLMIASRAPGARISLDGKAAAASPLIQEVEPGKHRVRVDAGGFFPVEHEVIAVEGELIFTEEDLRERPSSLVVSTRSDAEVYVDGVLAAQGGARVVLSLPAGTHRLAVAAKGHRVAHRSLALVRGETRAIHVPLEPTAQRTASHLLLIGGGAALGASLLLSAFAIRAEDRAEDFLGKQANGNVTLADLSRYDDAVRDRGIYRAATVATFGAAGGLFITGLLLHELDQPGLREIRLAAPSRGDDHARGTGDARRTLGVAPLLSAGSYGAALCTTF